MRILSETASAEIATPLNQQKSQIRGGREYDASQSSWKFPLVWSGGRWGLPEIVDYMETGALALLSNAARNRRYWLNSYNINKRAVNGWATWQATWVIPADQANKAGLAYVLRILTMGNVEVQRATQPFTSGGRTFAAGTYVIPMKRPVRILAPTMLEVQKYPDLREYPNGPPKRPYDVTAHTLPLLMNVEALPIAKFDQQPALSAKIPIQNFAFELPTSLKASGAPRILVCTKGGVRLNGIGLDALDARPAQARVRHDQGCAHARGQSAP